MDEQTIVDNLKQGIPQPQESEFTPTRPEIEPDSSSATPAVTIDLDEMTQYKLHTYFDERYREHDEVARQQLQYIYGEVFNMVEDKEYGFIVAKIHELERQIGIANSDKRRFKLYQWMKLNNVRRGIDAQMGAIT